jgi:N-acetylmuramoyl-L-alanine amidase
MVPAPRLKQRLLRQAVRANLDTIRGRPPRALRTRSHLWRALERGALLALVPTLAVLIFQVASRSVPAPAADPARAGTMLATFPAPRALAPVTAALAVRRIVLDPGHGGHDSGARAAGIWEKEITLDVARELRRLLQAARYDVVLTRDADAFLSLRERAQRANAERADLFVSVHVNSVPSQDCHAVETYYLGPADDPRAEALAGTENRESGYQLADFRRLLEGVYVHVRQAESRKLAQQIQHELVDVLGNTNPAIRDKGVRSAPFLVLVASDAPGVLAEVSCLSNDDEAARLAESGYRQRIARALFLGIHGYAEARNRTATLGTTQEASR